MCPDVLKQIITFCIVLASLGLAAAQDNQSIAVVPVVWTATGVE
jgi:hypothetical protein